MKVHAQEEGDLTAFNTFLCKVGNEIINPLMAVIALAAFLVFAWGVVEFIHGAGDEEKRRVGRRHMLWGIIGLAIVFGAGILVSIIGNIVGADTTLECT